jgi:hypothetical protein
MLHAGEEGFAAVAKGAIMDMREGLIEYVHGCIAE